MNLQFLVAQLAPIDLSADTVSLTVVVQLLVVLGIGILIGLEREFTRKEGQKLFAGIRTYPFITLLGFLSAFLSDAFTPWVFVLAGIGVLLFAGISYVATVRNGELGSTSEMAVLLAFLLGGLVFTGKITLAVGIAVAMTALLSLKLQFHALVGKFTLKDVYALLKFIVISVLVLPFLPNTPIIDTYPFLVLRDIWLIVVLVAAVGFAGYLLARFLGAQRGIIFTALIGSLVSSTAVTMEFSRKSRATPQAGAVYGIGIVLASSAMFVRILAIVFVVNQTMFYRLLVPLLLCAAVGGVVSLVLYKRMHGLPTSPDANVEVENPLDLVGALKFGAMYTGILFLIHFIRDYAGAQGIYVAGVLSGLTDVDAISVSMSKMAGNPIAWDVAQQTVVLATLSNSIVKYSMSLLWGSPSLRRATSIGFGSIIAAGVLVLIGMVWL